MMNRFTVAGRVKRLASEKAKPRLGWVVGLTSTAYFIVVLDSSVLIIALPRLQRDLHVGLSSLQWTFNTYGIAFAAGIITAAALGDRFGRRRVFNSGIALFTIASAACALAPSAGELIAARTVQGLAGSVVLPSLTILTTAFPAEKRGMIVGLYGGLAGLAAAIGGGVLIAGGFVLQSAGLELTTVSARRIGPNPSDSRSPQRSRQSPWSRSCVPGRCPGPRRRMPRRPRRERGQRIPSGQRSHSRWSRHAASSGNHDSSSA